MDLQIQYFAKHVAELCKDLKDARAFGQRSEFDSDVRKLRHVVQMLNEQARQERNDSAFFEGELHEEEEPKQTVGAHVGEEKEDSGECVAEFRKRRQKRKDEKCIEAYRVRKQKRLDARDGENGRWVTTENDNKLHINSEGVPDKGNPFIISRANKAFSEAAKNSDNAVEFWMNLSEEQQKQIGKSYKEVYEQLKKTAGEKPEWATPKGNKSDMPTRLKRPNRDIEVRVKNYSGKTKTADADEDGIITLNSANSDTWSDHVFMHEIGHQISALGILDKVAENPGGLWGRYNQKKHVLEDTLGFAQKNPDEAFADAFAYYKLYPEKLKGKSTDVFDYFERLSSENPWLGAWVDKAFAACQNVARSRGDYRSDADGDDEEGQWITTENNHHVHLNEEGEPDKGNPHVIQAMNSGDKDAYYRRRSKRQLAKAKEAVSRIADAEDRLKKAKNESIRAKGDYDLAEHFDKVTNRAKSQLEQAGYKEGDKEKIEKRLEEVKKKKDDMSYQSALNPSYRAEHKEELNELEAEYNQLRYYSQKYDDAFDTDIHSVRFSGGKRISVEEARNRLEKAQKAEKEASDDLDKARKELKESGYKAEHMKLYTPEERKTMVDSISSSDAFDGMTESGKEKVLQEIEKMPDAQLQLLQKTIGNVSINSTNGRVTSGGSTSWYIPGTGSIMLGERGMEEPKVAFHEYGHFFDDPKVSGCGMGDGDFGYPGSEYIKSVSDVIQERKILHGNDARDDLQKLVGDGMKVVNNDSGSWIGIENANGETDDWSQYDKLTEIVDERFRKFIYGDKEFEDYCHSIGMPMESERPNYDDYYETYKTPKRGLVRTREKFKGADEKYHEELREHLEKRENAREEHFDEYMEKLNAYNDRCKERESQIAPVSDIMCGMVRGQGPWIYGCHTADYYKYSEKPANEAIANYHQMRSMGWNDGLSLLKSLVPSVANGLEEVYNEWLWRNIDET